MLCGRPHGDQLPSARQEGTECLGLDVRHRAGERTHRLSTRGQGPCIPGIRCGSWPRGWRNVAGVPGITTTTGRPAVASAATTARWYPPVASRTISVGGTLCSRVTRAAIPGSSLATAQRAPVGRRAISRWALAPSRPTKDAGASITTPDGPDLARCGLSGAGQRYGLWENRTRRPTLRCGLQRPRLDRSIVSPYGVTGLPPRHTSKDTGLEAVRCSARLCKNLMFW